LRAFEAAERLGHAEKKSARAGFDGEPVAACEQASIIELADEVCANEGRFFTSDQDGRRERHFLASALEGEVKASVKCKEETLIARDLRRRDAALTRKPVYVSGKSFVKHSK
jgi:hypothetical protein